MNGERQSVDPGDEGQIHAGTRPADPQEVTQLLADWSHGDMMDEENSPISRRGREASHPGRLAADRPYHGDHYDVKINFELNTDAGSGDR